MSRSWPTIDDPENARTGPSAWGSPAMARALPRGPGRGLGGRRASTPANLLIVDLIAEHDGEAPEEFAGEGDLRLGTTAAMQDGAVAAPKIIVRAHGQRGRRAQHPAEQRSTRLGDLTEMRLIGRGVE